MIDQKLGQQNSVDHQVGGGVGDVCGYFTPVLSNCSQQLLMISVHCVILVELQVKCCG